MVSAPLPVEVVQDGRVTPADIDAALPNGFHDAYLRELHMDYAVGEARLAFDFLVGDPDADAEVEREAMRPGVLRLRGVTSMTIEPPHPSYRFAADDGLWVDGDFGPYPGEPPPADDGLIRLWLFVRTWNARMLFTAREFALEWT